MIVPSLSLGLRGDVMKVGRYRGKIAWNQMEYDTPEEREELLSNTPHDGDWIEGFCNYSGNVPYILGEIIEASDNGVLVAYWFPVCFNSLIPIVEKTIPVPMVTITREEYAMLLTDKLLVKLLYDHNVDEWEEYEEAMVSMNDQIDRILIDQGIYSLEELEERR